MREIAEFGERARCTKEWKINLSNVLEISIILSAAHMSKAFALNIPLFE